MRTKTLVVGKDWLYGDSRTLRFVVAHDVDVSATATEALEHVSGEHPDWRASPALCRASPNDVTSDAPATATSAPYGALADARDEGSAPASRVEYRWIVGPEGGPGWRDVRVVLDGNTERWAPMRERLTELEASGGNDVGWDVGSPAG